MKRLARSILPIVIAFVVYIVYTGSIRLYDIITGIAVSLIVGTLTATIVVEDWRKSLDIRRLALFIVYVFKYFLVHEVKAHINVIKLGFSPSMPIKPGIVRIPIKSRSGYAITMVSLAITNTPGTVVVDLNEDKSTLYVHWIYVKAVEPVQAYREVAEDFDRYARRVFD